MIDILGMNDGLNDLCIPALICIPFPIGSDIAPFPPLFLKSYRILWISLPSLLYKHKA